MLEGIDRVGILRAESQRGGGLIFGRILKPPPKKIAGYIGAIPIVESVLASLRNIADKTAHARPPYSEEAGLGYGIAL